MAIRLGQLSIKIKCSNVHYLGSSENKAWKNSGLYGIWTHDLCNTSAVLYQLS